MNQVFDKIFFYFKNKSKISSDCLNLAYGLGLIINNLRPKLLKERKFHVVEKQIAYFTFIARIRACGNPAFVINV